MYEPNPIDNNNVRATMPALIADGYRSLDSEGRS
jgi:hypothetical protein